MSPKVNPLSLYRTTVEISEYSKDAAGKVIETITSRKIKAEHRDVLITMAKNMGEEGRLLAPVDKTDSTIFLRLIRSITGIQIKDNLFQKKVLSNLPFSGVISFHDFFPEQDGMKVRILFKPKKNAD